MSYASTVAAELRFAAPLPSCEVDQAAEDELAAKIERAYALIAPMVGEHGKKGTLLQLLGLLEDIDGHRLLDEASVGTVDESFRAFEDLHAALKGYVTCIANGEPLREGE